MTRNPLKVWASGTTLEGQTPDAYTPPPSRHWVNYKMPQVGVELETFGFTVNPGTLSYSGGRKDILKYFERIFKP